MTWFSQSEISMPEPIQKLQIWRCKGRARSKERLWMYSDASENEYQYVFFYIFATLFLAIWKSSPRSFFSSKLLQKLSLYRNDAEFDGAYGKNNQGPNELIDFEKS